MMKQQFFHLNKILSLSVDLLQLFDLLIHCYYINVPLHFQIASSSSIINKMSIAKSEQTITNKRNDNVER